MVLRMTLKEPLISQVPLFANLPPHEHAYLAATLRQVTYPSGELLFREGDFGEHFYIVLKGELEIIKAFGTANELMLDARGNGEFVGEMSMFNRDNVRTATVRARGLTQLLEMHHPGAHAAAQPTEYVRLRFQRLYGASARGQRRFLRFHSTGR
jgi:CRP/FNR family cyclic AMP-dependent transcriptional regulator